MKPEIRAVRRTDLSQVYDLLTQAFPEAKRSLFVAQTESDSTFRLRHGRVAVVDDRGVGYVRIFARTMLVRGVPTTVGGIGSVATHPEARSGGIATALLRDAIEEMRLAGMAASFLFTGIPGFYARLGYRIVREPHFEADAADVAALPDAELWDIRPLVTADLTPMLAIYRRTIVGSSGAIVRTRRTWRDATAWTDEDASGCFVAEHNNTVVAYLRSRRRGHHHHVLEAECVPEHEGAVTKLLSAVGRRAESHDERVAALAPDAHPLATALRTLPSTVETLDVEHPMMALPLDGRGDELISEPVRWWNTDRI